MTESILKKALRSGLTYCIACENKGSTECKWACVREKESNKYSWIPRSQEDSKSPFPTCEKKDFLKDLITV